MLLAKTAPKLYVGGLVCDPKAKEWVTWKAGFNDKLFVKSALPPSKKKLVRCVPEPVVSEG